MTVKQNATNNLIDSQPIKSTAAPMVNLTWNGHVEDEVMIAVFKELELYTITPGWDSKFKGKFGDKLTSKTWWLLKLWDVTNTFYVAFYLNIIPFICVLISSVLLIMGKIEETVV